MASSRPPHPPHRQHPHDPPSPDSNLGYQNSTDDANPHRGAGVRSSTGTTPAAAVQAPPGFTIWPNWLRDRLTSDPHLNEPTINRAIRLYLELRGRFTNYHTGRGMPRRQTLATELRVSLKTIDRVLDVLRRVGAIRTTLLHDRRGHVTGMEFLVFDEAGPDPDGGSQKDTTVPLDTPKRSPQSTGQNSRKTSKASPESFCPKGLYSPTQKDSGDAPFLSTYQDLNTEDLVVVVQQDLDRTAPPERQQQQHHDDEPPDDVGTDEPPTVEECLRAFYAAWAQQHASVYDVRTSDGRHMANITAKAQQAGVGVLDLIGTYLVWQDDALVVSKHHPLGLLAVNVGSVITYHRTRYPVIVEDEDDGSPGAVRRRMAAAFGTPRWRGTRH